MMFLCIQEAECVCVCISREHAALHLLLMSVESYASCPVDFGSRNIWEANFALNDTVIKTAVCLGTTCFSVTSGLLTLKASLLLLLK